MWFESVQSLALRSALRNAHYLSELLDSCRAAAAGYPSSHHMAAVRVGWWESGSRCVFDGDYRGEHDDTFLCGSLELQGFLWLTQNAVFQCFCELKGISLRARLLFLMCPGLNIQLPFLQLHSFLWLKQCVRNVKTYELCLCCGLWSSARRASCYFRSWI